MVSQNTIIVVAGNKLRLDVEITGEPAPTPSLNSKPFMPIGKVVAVNIAGRSPPATLSQPVTIREIVDSIFFIRSAEREHTGTYDLVLKIENMEDRATINIRIVGLEHKPAAFKEKDMACAPKFTQPLVDRSVVAGYSTAISCSVRGFPRNNQGVLTLNIRKPSSFDAGKYSCMAVNDLGQDEVECKLDVRGKDKQDGCKGGSGQKWWRSFFTAKWPFFIVR
ncbi:hypothetical protein XENOCAPTIV_024171 [Xenoophorus captivus]|uniref:Immunoglobulin domain-containing protein n=1 Tax=Xenoophorus captivus TaxID=1517983 RepID=A0ABV0QMT1_9TELE